MLGARGALRSRSNSKAAPQSGSPVAPRPPAPAPGEALAPVRARRRRLPSRRASPPGHRARSRAGTGTTTHGTSASTTTATRSRSAPSSSSGRAASTGHKAAVVAAAGLMRLPSWRRQALEPRARAAAFGRDGAALRARGERPCSSDGRMTRWLLRQSGHPPRLTFRRVRLCDQVQHVSNGVARELGEAA